MCASYVAARLGAAAGYVPETILKSYSYIIVIDIMSFVLLTPLWHPSWEFATILLCLSESSTTNLGATGAFVLTGKKVSYW